jgi:hypothetical protein
MNPVDTHKWLPKDSLEPRCAECGCRLIIPYGDITEEAVTPCPGPAVSNGDQ